MTRPQWMGPNMAPTLKRIGWALVCLFLWPFALAHYLSKWHAAQMAPVKAEAEALAFEAKVSKATAAAIIKAEARVRAAEAEAKALAAEIKLQELKNKASPEA